MGKFQVAIYFRLEARHFQSSLMKTLILRSKLTSSEKIVFFYFIEFFGFLKHMVQFYKNVHFDLDIFQVSEKSLFLFFIYFIISKI